MVISKLKLREKRSYAAPENARIYAIGDIHGRDDLLKSLHELIRDDAANHRRQRKIIIYLGDYIDRGPSSRDVLDYLIGSPLEGFETVYLKGNHEALLLRFLEDARVGPDWIMIGGGATLESYHVEEKLWSPNKDDFSAIQKSLSERLPPSHLEFLLTLAPYHIEGDYFFVHAGVRPGIAIEDQTEEDLLWIRNDFLNSTADHGHLIVHGHSIAKRPVIKRNRIGIDTGAFTTGRLTCLITDREETSFLST